MGAEAATENSPSVARSATEVGAPFTFTYLPARRPTAFLAASLLGASAGEAWGYSPRRAKPVRLCEFGPRAPLRSLSAALRALHRAGVLQYTLGARLNFDVDVIRAQ